MELTLAERFPSLNPIAIRKEKAREVFTLLRRLAEKKARESKEKKPRKRVIRRPAGDNWF